MSRVAPCSQRLKALCAELAAAPWVSCRRWYQAPCLPGPSCCAHCAALRASSEGLCPLLCFSSLPPLRERAPLLVWHLAVPRGPWDTKSLFRTVAAMDLNPCFRDCLEGGLLLFPSSLIHQEPSAREHEPGERAEEVENSHIFAARPLGRTVEGGGCLLRS